ncbi:MAG TPA: FkbM family methyltransferase [Acidimicrobiales bacterium]|nr:FkbM family methyltransferase [Acidimicrobiales bacterium]
MFERWPPGDRQAAQRLKECIKKARDYPPLNRAMTSALRSGVRRAGRVPAPLVRFLPRVGTVEAPLPSGDTLRLWSRGDDDIATAVFWRGWSGHEPETSPYFYELATRASVTLDVGAHVGYFSLLAALANRSGTVHAFEPLPAARARLERNLSLNRLGNVFVHAVALADRSGSAEFFYVPDSIPSSSSLSRPFMESIVAKDRLAVAEVSVTTGDQFVAAHDIEKVDLVKIDTEATEDAVLEGMVDTLERDGPSVICEILPDAPAKAIEDLLRSLGYRFALITGSGPRPCEHVTPHPTWRNFLFRRSDNR